MITWLDVTTRFPNDANLSSLPVGAQAEILEEVNDEVIHDETWRNAAKANRARMYLAAHLGTISATGRGSVGPVQSESVGQVSRSYAVSTSEGSDPLDGTSYGKEYKRLVRMQFAGPWVA